MIRELILQMKLGHVRDRYFQRQVRRRYSRAVCRPGEQICATRVSWFPIREGLRLNRDGLLQVDRLLYEFFLPEHRNVSHA